MNLPLIHLRMLLTVSAIRGTVASETKSLKYPKWQLVNSEECGPVRMGSRITGGKAAPIGQYPWMARLGYERYGVNIKFKCGGSLINQKYVLTAGHCICGYESLLRIVRLGEHFANTTEDCEEGICALPVQDIPVEKTVLHPDYDNKMVKNDIALIRLSLEAEYNEFVKPICLPRDGILKKNYISQSVEIAGWGIMNSTTEQEANTLLFVTLPVRDSCACDKLMPELHIDSNQFCVGLETGEDSCTGDSGGPMMKMEPIMGRKKYHVLGIVSVGKSYCGESPAVYTNVIKYVDWILKTIADTEYQYETKADVTAPPHN